MRYAVARGGVVIPVPRCTVPLSVRGISFSEEEMTQSAWRFILFMFAWLVVALILLAAISQVSPAKFDVPVGSAAAAIGMVVLLGLGVRGLGVLK
jgi:hypothetical protein